MISSEELAELCMEQDIETIIAKFDGYIHKRAKRMITSFPNGYEVDDLIQIGRVTVWELAVHPSRPKLVQYFYGAIKNSILVELRNSKRKKRLCLSNAFNLDARVCDGSNDTFLDLLVDDKLIELDDLLIQSEQIKKIEHSVNKLSKIKRTYLHMWAKGYEGKEIAAIFNKSGSSVHSNLFSAKRTVRSDLNV